MTVKEDLIKVRAKIEAGWCRGTAARDKGGNDVASTDQDATQFCILGAFGAARLANDCQGLYQLYRTLKHEEGHTSLAEFNDAPGRTQEEVLALFDKAIDCAS